VEREPKREGTRRSLRRPPARWLALLVVLASVAAACGSRLPTKVLSEIDAQRTGAARGAASGSGTTGGAAPSSTGGEAAAGDTGGVAASTGGSSATGGEATPAPGAGSATGGAAPAKVDCSGVGATAPGVTATEIKVGAIVTASGPLPGATEGSFRGAQAYLAKVNAAGGVCGRHITLLKGDDGLDPQRARSEFLRLSPQVLAMVGGYSVADSGFSDLVKSTNIPYLGVLVDPSGRGPNVVPHVPSNVAETAPYVYYKSAYPDVKKVAFLYADVGGVRANTPAVREALKRVGYQLVEDSGLSAVTPDYTPDVIAMRNAGAQMVYLFAFEVNMHVRFARNMRQQNFEPPLKVAQIGYNSDLTQLLGPIADGWTTPLTYLPILDADEPAKSPAVAEFLQWNQRVAPGAQVDLFPVSGWDAASLFVRALQQVGGNVTRDRLLAALRAMHTDDGDGLIAPIDPVTGIGNHCFIVVRVKEGRWVREHPATGFDCGHGEAYKYG
jgi:ABC-type branched-subunit amino acid transport system substrate-binding protein